jgi:DnaJ-class molecular chaperone
MIINSAIAARAAEDLDLELNHADADKVVAAYRAASKTCHPDSGTYDAKRWHEISVAKDTLLEWFKRKAAAMEPVRLGAGDCRACGGTGRIRRGNSLLQMMCMLCYGTGNTVKKDREE